jgi:hypothetical protein
VSDRLVLDFVQSGRCSLDPEAAGGSWPLARADPRTSDHHLRSSERRAWRRLVIHRARAGPLAAPALDVIHLYFREIPKLTDEVGVAEAEKLAAAAQSLN